MEEEYLPDQWNDNEYLYNLKQVISELDDLDRAILIVYAEEGSMAKTGEKFGVSVATIYAQIVRIRNIIKERL